jgi:hypothetical protein
MARIDAAFLDCIWLKFFHHLIFDIRQLAQFMRRTARFEALNEAHVGFKDEGVKVESLPPTYSFDEKFSLMISCKDPDWELLSLAQIFTSFFPSIYMMEHLYIYTSRWQGNIENMHLLRPHAPHLHVRSSSPRNTSLEASLAACHNLYFIWHVEPDEPPLRVRPRRPCRRRCKKLKCPTSGSETLNDISVAPFVPNRARRRITHSIAVEFMAVDITSEHHCSPLRSPRLRGHATHLFR